MFKCAFNETYGSHRLFFCVCVQCHKNIKNDCNNIGPMNNKWMKFCVLRPALEILNFSGNMRFFSFNDIIISLKLKKRMLPLKFKISRAGLKTQNFIHLLFIGPILLQSFLMFLWHWTQTQKNRRWLP